MTREELEHAIRAACDVAGDSELYVFGSQAILGQHPDAPDSLRQSVEADVAPKNRPDRTINIDGALGEGSRFHETFGFYVHGVPLEAATFPDGWESRLIPIQNENTRRCTGWCVEEHDLAASKLVAFREKDRGFVRTLLLEGLVEESTLVARIRSLAIAAEDQERLATWVTATCQELA